MTTTFATADATSARRWVRGAGALLPERHGGHPPFFANLVNLLDVL